MTTAGTPPNPAGLWRSNVIVASGTAMSRLTGLARVVVFGIVIGQTALADAYDGANNSPNSIYELLLGGVLSASLVPLFTRHVEREDPDATEAVVSVAVVVLFATTLVAVLAAPWIFRMFSLTPADGVDVEALRRTGTALARIFLVQIFFYGLTTLATALLHARRRFFAAAWSPVLANLVIIASLAMVPGVIDSESPSLVDAGPGDPLTWVLGLGATAGIATMALALIPALGKAGVRLRFRPDWRHPAVRTLVSLSGWTFGFVIANQIALIVVKNLAEPGSGGQDAYTKAFIFFQLPHGLLAMSIATTFAPELARRVASRDRRGFVTTTRRGVHLIALATIPASLGLLVLARPLVGALLQHGQFDADAADTTARALAGFSIGLAGFSIYLFTLRGFYAHNDTRTPFVVNTAENLINIALAVVFVRWWDVAGLGLAFGLAYLVSAVWALRILARKVGQFELRPLVVGLVPIVLAAVVMAQITWLISRRVGADEGVGAWVRCGVGGVTGVVTFIGLAGILGVPEIRSLAARVRRLAVRTER
jgi:putative peptidoglycan lipid II flippase